MPSKAATTTLPLPKAWRRVKGRGGWPGSIRPRGGKGDDAGAAGGKCYLGGLSGGARATGSGAAERRAMEVRGAGACGYTVAERAEKGGAGPCGECGRRVRAGQRLGLGLRVVVGGLHGARAGRGGSRRTNSARTTYPTTCGSGCGPWAPLIRVHKLRFANERCSGEFVHPSGSGLQGVRSM